MPWPMTLRPAATHTSSMESPSTRGCVENTVTLHDVGPPLLTRQLHGIFFERCLGSVRLLACRVRVAHARRNPGRHTVHNGIGELTYGSHARCRWCCCRRLGGPHGGCDLLLEFPPLACGLPGTKEVANEGPTHEGAYDQCRLILRAYEEICETHRQPIWVQASLEFGMMKVKERKTRGRRSGVIGSPHLQRRGLQVQAR